MIAAPDETLFVSEKFPKSPYYAPEYFISSVKEHTTNIDMWNFGVILYYICFGKEPRAFRHIYGKLEIKKPMPKP
jgi:serine/threonine protein kinase